MATHSSSSSSVFGRFRDTDKSEARREEASKKGILASQVPHWVAGAKSHKEVHFIIIPAKR